MKLIKIAFISLIFQLMICSNLFAQFHFVFTSNTGNNATIGIPTSVNPNINGALLQNGDEIGVFTPNGLCVGAVIWQNQNTVITVWGDNEITPIIDGIKPGERMFYRIWQKSTNTEITNCSVTYSLGSEFYSVNGIYILSSLIALISEVNTIDLTNKFGIELFQNFPNPFNNTTKFKLLLKQDAFVVFDVFNSLGHKLGNIFSAPLKAGINEINYSANQLPSGIYLLNATIKLKNEAQSFSISKKFVIIK